jgi:hypothetical protein
MDFGMPSGFSTNKYYIEIKQIQNKEMKILQ